MERRTAIKSIAISLGSLVSLPTWAAGWNAATLHTAHTLGLGTEALLAEMADTIIPKTETLGAKDVGVHQFIQRMLTDCYTRPVQDNFEKNLSNIDPLSTQVFMKPFAALDMAQRLHILKLVAQSTEKEIRDFYKLLRGLTIQGYTSSEYYLTNFTDYEMAPARFYGCVPVKQP